MGRRGARAKACPVVRRTSDGDVLGRHFLHGGVVEGLVPDPRGISSVSQKLVAWGVVAVSLLVWLHVLREAMPGGCLICSHHGLRWRPYSDCRRVGALRSRARGGEAPPTTEFWWRDDSVLDRSPKALKGCHLSVEPMFTSRNCSASPSSSEFARCRDHWRRKLCLLFYFCFASLLLDVHNLVTQHFVSFGRLALFIKRGQSRFS